MSVRMAGERCAAIGRMLHNSDETDTSNHKLLASV